MTSFNLQGLLILILIVLLVFGARRTRHISNGLYQSMQSMRPEVFSAETIDHHEAEFVRDRSPRRFPIWLVTVVFISVMTVLVWWTGR